jgi:predicted transcriptional regulator
MRTLLLSLKPEVFDTVLLGEKIYEHRKVFPEEPIDAYIYISRPVQALAGVMHLGNKAYLSDWKEKYSNDTDAVSRIDKYMEHYKVAMEIQSFQNTTQIPLSVVRERFPDFLIPQMYYYLDDLPLLEFMKENLKPLGEPIVHEFNNVTSNLICIH